MVITEVLIVADDDTVPLVSCAAADGVFIRQI